MNIVEILKQSLESLKGNKLRSFLTMLGIIMGVFSIIAIVATGNAVTAYVNAEFEKMGAGTVTILKKSNAVNENDWLGLDDVEIIKAAVPYAKSVAPYTSSRRGGTVRIDSSLRDISVNGVTEHTKDQSTLELLEGRYVNEADVKAKAEVCLIDSSFATQYFNKTDIVGNRLALKNSEGSTWSFTVIGVISAEKNAMFHDEDDPVSVVMPITTAQSFTGSEKLSNIQMVIEDKSKLEEAGIDAVKALEFKHGNVDKYKSSNSQDMLSTVNSVLGTIQLALGVIAAITLVVGGIGIINIMLVSVTERTREIGVRKAIGALKRDIILQFVTESVIMTGISGLIGILLGITAGSIISSVIKIPPVVDIVTIVLAFLSSLILGLAFGVYPAKRAADLDPIESLRYE